jgi:ribulose 1,5-bisphosphate synthetase/thiazole synthase
MTANVRMVNQNWWITTLMIKEHKYCPPLTKAIKCDAFIVGEGFSGVSAAAECAFGPDPAGTVSRALPVCD